MKKEELIAIPVSFYRNMKSSVAEPVTIGPVLDAIRGSFYETQASKMRLTK